jgi:vitamin B12 transporter
LVMFRQWTNKSYAAFNSLHKILKICTLTLAYTILTSPVHVKAEVGDTTGIKTLELDEVTIQSTLIELKNSETGRSIDIINGAQIQSLPVNSIDELLRYVPGIDAQQRGAFGSQTDFSLRGCNFNQVLVLIDGQKINDPLTAHFNSNIPISLSEIERIEIIHGPASLEYGPDATGGVINIITKTFSKNYPSQKFSANAKVFAGQYRLFNTDDGFYYGNEKFRVSGGIIINKSDGNPLESGQKGYFDIRDLTLSGQLKINDIWSASYRYANDYRDFNAQFFYTDYASDKAIETVKRQRHQIQFLRNGENYSTQILASYLITNDHYLYSPTSIANNNNSGNISLKAQQQVNVSSRIKTLFGAGVDQRSVISSNRGNHKLLHGDVFATFSTRLFNQFTLNGGLREDLDENYGSYFLPQLGASYKVANSFVLRTSFGRSVRAADYTENYNDNYRTDSLKSSPGIGNRNLSPEKSWNSELGIDYKILSGVLFSITGFNRSVTDLIDYVKIPGSDIHIDSLKLYPATEYWYAENNSKTNTYGLETRLTVNRKFGAVNFGINVGYTFLKINLDSKKAAKYAMLQPKHLINGDITFEYKILNWSINGLHKERNEIYSSNLKTSLISSYTILNTNLDIAVYKRLMFISVAVYNVFDQHYSDFLGAEMPGRWIAFGAKMKL